MPDNVSFSEKLNGHIGGLIKFTKFCEITGLGHFKNKIGLIVDVPTSGLRSQLYQKVLLSIDGHVRIYDLHKLEIEFIGDT